MSYCLSKIGRKIGEYNLDASTLMRLSEENMAAAMHTTSDEVSIEEDSESIFQPSFATESNICNRLKVCDCKMGLPSASAKYMTPKKSLLSANLNQIPNTVL